MGKLIFLPSSHGRSQPRDRDYISSVSALAKKADAISHQYGLAPKDVLTDAICLLVEEAILAQCQGQTPPDPPSPVA